MAALSAAATPASLLAAPPAPPTAPSATELAKRGEIHKTAQKFEASFLSMMIGQMFEQKDDGTDPAFTGGDGAKMFQSFLAESIANKMVAAGGIGLTASVQREMLKMQGLH